MRFPNRMSRAAHVNERDSNGRIVPRFLADLCVDLEYSDPQRLEFGHRPPDGTLDEDRIDRAADHCEKACLPGYSRAVALLGELYVELPARECEELPICRHCAVRVGGSRHQVPVRTRSARWRFPRSPAQTETGRLVFRQVATVVTERGAIFHLGHRNQCPSLLHISDTTLAVH